MNILPYFCGFDGFIGHDGCWIPARREPPEPKFEMPEIVIKKPTPSPVRARLYIGQWLELAAVIFPVLLVWEVAKPLVQFAARMVVRVMQ
jgi:hypothetical protein